MADPTIRQAVKTAQPSSGVGGDFGVGAIDSIGQSIGGAIGAVEQFATGAETRKRKENAEMADADMFAYTAFMSETSTTYNVALSETNDPAEIDAINKQYKNDVSNYIGDNKNMRNGMSRKAASSYFKKNESEIFNNPAFLRKTQLNRRDSAAKYESAIISTKMQPLMDDKKFKAQLTDTYRKLEGMGVYTREEANTLIKNDMKQKELDKTKFVTASFQNEVNEYARYAADRIAEYQTNPILMKDPQRLAENIKSTLDRYDQEVANEEKYYREDIEKSKLNVEQKRYFLKQIDTNLNYQKSYLNKLNSQIKDAQVSAESDNIIKFQSEVGLAKPNEMASLDTLKSYGLPNDFIESYQKSWITKKSAEQTFVEGGLKMVAIADELRDMNPQSDKAKFNKLVRDAAGIVNGTQRLQTLKQIEDHRDPKRYNEPIMDYIKERRSQLKSVIGEADIEVLGPGFDDDFTKIQKEQLQYDIEQHALRVFKKTGDIKEATDIIDNAFNKMQDEDTAEVFANSYYPDASEALFDAMTAPDKSPKIDDAPKEKVYKNKHNGKFYYQDKSTGRMILIK